MRVISPEGYRPEREYAIAAFFGFLLDEMPAIEFRAGASEYAIELGEGRRLVLPDLFFGRIEGFVASQRIPRAEDVVLARNDFLEEADLPVFYGTGAVLRREGEIRIEVDVFASVFFMLTRWEEIGNRARDRHARFPGSESLAFKAAFLDRPVVEEYAAMIRKAASSLLPSIAWKERRFELRPTHDIDKVDYYGSKKRISRKLLRGKFKDRLGHLRNIVVGRNPWWTFSYLMERSEAYGLQSSFFFLHSRETRHDFSYDMERPRFQALFREMRARGHRIGLHGSYASFDNLALTLEEKAYVEGASGLRVSAARQHFLRFSPAATWPMLEAAGIEEDFSAGYADALGFRCGTGESFAAYDLIGRRKLSLVETPLVIMDGTLTDYLGYDPDRAAAACRALIDRCLRYRTKCAILFHNSSFSASKSSAWDLLYEEILSYASRPR